MRTAIGDVTHTIWPRSHNHNLVVLVQMMTMVLFPTPRERSTRPKTAPLPVGRLETRLLPGNILLQSGLTLLFHASRSTVVATGRIRIRVRGASCVFRCMRGRFRERDARNGPGNLFEPTASKTSIILVMAKDS